MAWDDRFVLARQQELKPRSPNDPNDTYMEPAPGKFHYWILDTSIPATHGPLTQTAFDAEKKRLQIPLGLMLKDVYEFRPER